MENIFVQFLPPWVETGLQPAFYDKESGTVLQQTARMYARVNMLIRMFNKLSKNTKEEVETFETNVNETVNHYIEEFTTLYNYVHDYFDNLDVQEEINNKLDAMVEAGTLQDILLNYATVSKVYETTRAMLADADNLVVGEKVRTLGYYTLNDGGGAEFVITDTTTTRYQITLGDSKYATLISRNINVDQLGANGGNNALSYYFDTLEDAQAVYPNATALTELIGGVAIQCAIDYFHDNKIELNANTYYISSALSTNTNNRVHLCGNSKWKSVIRKIGVEGSENTILILGSSSSRNVIENIDFVGPDEVTDTTQATLESYKTNGILFNSSSYNQINNCVFRQCGSGIKFTYSWTNTITDCYFARCNYGINSGGASANNCLEINHCFTEYCNYGIYLGEGRSQLVINCDVEHCNVHGIRKTNEGDIQILSSYFESDIEIFYGQTYTRNVLIASCSFYQTSSDNKPFYTPIVFNGNASGNTQVTIQNCNFVDGNSEGDYSNNPAVMQINNATTVPPVLINNTVTNMIEFRPVYMRGVHIHNGVMDTYFHRTFAQNNINASDGGNMLFDYNAGLDYRLNLMASGTYSIKIPTVGTNDRYVPRQFRIIVGPNNQASNLGTVSLIPNDSSTCDVNGHTTISISDKNKVISIFYLGNWSSKDHWVATVSA